MEELLDKLDNLKNILDESEIVKEIKEANASISKDKELLSLLEEYQNHPTEELKEKIMSNKHFKEYKEKETNLNLLILDTNQRLKSLSSHGGCNL